MLTPVQEIDWTIEGSDGEIIFGHAHVPARNPAGTLLIAHGFKGYKDYGFFPLLAGRAAEAGFCAYRFNFSHSGMTNAIETFQRPDLFERDTWNRQVYDLHAVHRALAEGRLPGAEAPLPAVWFGHSRGGVTTLLATARLSPCHAPPAGVVTAASPATAYFLDEDQRSLLRRVGRIASPSSRTGQTLHIGRAVLDEIDADPTAFDPVQAAAQLPCPLLVMHGDDDQTVPPAAAEQLAAAGGDLAHRHIVAGASHTFNAPNPLPVTCDAPTATTMLIDTVLAFAADAVGERA